MSTRCMRAAKPWRDPYAFVPAALQLQTHLLLPMSQDEAEASPPITEKLEELTGATERPQLAARHCCGSPPGPMRSACAEAAVVGAFCCVSH